MAVDKWWLALKADDRVYIPRERNKDSGMGTVTQNGKKYISVWFNGQTIRITKSDGCTECYPKFPVARDEKHWMDMVWQRKRITDAVDELNKACRTRSVVFTKEHADLVEAFCTKLIEDTAR